MKKYLAVIIIFCALTFALRSTPLVAEPSVQSASEEGYVFLQSWGKEIGRFASPADVMVVGNWLYVLDEVYNEVQVFQESDNRPLFAFGGTGTATGQFRGPKGLAASPDGRLIYVADTGNNRIQIFSREGSFQDFWNGSGQSGGAMYSPYNVEVDTSGIYVVDTGRNRILKYDHDLNLIAQWDGSGQGLEGKFQTPISIGINSSRGQLFITDSDNSRIQVYSSSGAYIRQWGVEGTGNGQFLNPTGITVTEGKGRFSGTYEVVVVDSDTNRVQEFLEDGTFLGKWGEDDLEYPQGVSIDDEGTAHIADTSNLRVSQFTSARIFSKELGNEDGQLIVPQQITVDNNNNIYVTHSYLTPLYERKGSVQKFTASGSFLNQWGTEGTEHLVNPTGIVNGSSGQFYVVDPPNHRVFLYSPEGQLITDIGENGDGEGEFFEPQDIALDGEGNIYVTDKSNLNRVQMFGPNGEDGQTWGPLNVFSSPHGIAIDKENEWVYIANTGSNCIVKLTLEGVVVQDWGEAGCLLSQFLSPEDVAIDDDANVYVIDTGNNRVQKFTSDGIFITQWGNFGHADGEFNHPVGIAVDHDGNVYVADEGNARIQKFSSDYPVPVIPSGLVQNGNFEAVPDLAYWTYGGSAPVEIKQDPFFGRTAQLGLVTPPLISQPNTSAWIYQTIYVPPDWERPILQFDYRLFVNDIIDYADFRVWLTTSNGGVLAEVIRDGYRPCDEGVAPATTKELWREKTYDLTAYKGQVLRIRFEARNIFDSKSWGIWAYVDNVSVQDTHSPPPALSGDYQLYAPIISNPFVCDP